MLKKEDYDDLSYIWSALQLAVFDSDHPCISDLLTAVNARDLPRFREIFNRVCSAPP